MRSSLPVQFQFHFIGDIRETVLFINRIPGSGGIEFQGGTANFDRIAFQLIQQFAGKSLPPVFRAGLHIGDVTFFTGQITVRWRQSHHRQPGTTGGNIVVPRDK